LVSNSKLYVKLDALESELLSRLIPHLKTAAQGGNEYALCATGYHHFAKPVINADPTMNELVSLGAEILRLKQKLDEPSVGSIAERLCWYCREWGKNQRPGTPSTQSLAKAFLSEIENQ